MIGTVGLTPGTVVEGWQVVRAIRAGGFGVVHEARQYGRAGALKLARHREDSGDTGHTHERAQREVGLLLLMKHPNIIKAIAHGCLPDGRMFLVLEYVDGWTLGEWVERTHPTVREILHVFVQIASAVAYMHAMGVRHRDLKLSNVMIRKSNNEPVVIDLGCASFPNAGELTTTPLPPGTERYRTPQAQAFLSQHGRQQGAHYQFQVADELFAVGVMLYEVLTEPLPSKDNPRPYFADPLTAPIPARKVNPRVPEALSTLVEELLARDPAQRPESFEALQRELAELAGHPGPEYAAQAHPPSTQRQPAPGVGGQAAQEAAPRKRRSRKSLALGGLGVAAVLAGGAAAWLAYGEHPLPSSGPKPSSVTSFPASVPAPALDAAPAIPATAQKEGSIVKPQPPDVLQPARPALAPKSAPTRSAPGSQGWCKAVPVVVALAHGCTAPQLMPDQVDCPPGVIEIMDELGWKDREITMKVDEKESSGGPASHSFYTPGPVVGLVDKKEGADQFWAPPGTTFSGRLYVTRKPLKEDVGQMVVIYDHVDIPGKGKFPVCVGRSMFAYELKDGKARGNSYVNAFPLDGRGPSGK
jgi:predicted Ser/Thr protein kinase